MNSDDYDYQAAGFDNFLSRSIEGNPRINLDSPSPPNNAVAFDRTQVTGPVGDTLRIGKISFNGANGNVVINDGNNDFLLMGEE